jgi:hypothetical protein
MALLAAGAAFLPGCGEPPEARVARHPARGRVLYKGQPLGGAAVALHPVDDAKYGKDVPRPSSRTGEDGKFQLTTYEANDGAPAGSYIVTISSAPKARREGGILNDPKSPIATDVLKGRYLDPKKSKLKVEIKEGENDLAPIDLQ